MMGGSPPWYTYAVLAILAGGGGGFMSSGMSLFDRPAIASEVARDLSERDRRIESMERVVRSFEVRCAQITERLARMEAREKYWKSH